MGATWVQGHPAEMLKSLSLGACVVKTVACQHTSAHATPYKTEHVDFTQVLQAFLSIGLGALNFLKCELLILHWFYN